MGVEKLPAVRPASGGAAVRSSGGLGFGEVDAVAQVLKLSDEPIGVGLAVTGVEFDVELTAEVMVGLIAVEQMAVASGPTRSGRRPEEPPRQESEVRAQSSSRGCPRLPRATNNGLAGTKRADVAGRQPLFSSQASAPPRGMDN